MGVEVGSAGYVEATLAGPSCRLPGAGSIRVSSSPVSIICTLVNREQAPRGVEAEAVCVAQAPGNQFQVAAVGLAAAILGPAILATLIEQNHPVAGPGSDYDDKATTLRGRTRSGNLQPHIREAVRAYCTVGEIAGALRDKFGVYQPPTRF